MRILHAALVAALFASGGCTSIKVMPDVTRVDRTEAMEGIPYALPMRQYAIKIVRTVKTCPDVTKGDKAKIEFDIKVTAEPKLVPGERYVVDYRALGGLVKTSDFAIENHAAGTLKAVNIAAEDQSADVIKDVVSTGLSVASTGLGIPGSSIKAVPEFDKSNKAQWSLMGTDFAIADPQANERWTILCTKKTIDALETRKTAKKALKDATDKLKEENQRVEDLALAGVIGNDEKKALLAQLTVQRAQSKKVEEAEKAYADALDETGAVEELVWPRDFADGDTAGQLSRPRYDPSDHAALITGDRQLPIGEPYMEKLAGMFAPAKVPASAGKDNPCFGDDSIAVRACIEPQLTLFARFDAQLGDGRCADAAANRHRPFNCHQAEGRKPVPPGAEAPTGAREQYRADLARYKATIPSPARDFNPEQGMLIRPPELGRLLICKVDSHCVLGSDDMALTGDWVAIPQLGQLRLLPFINRMFESNLLVVQLAEDGSIIKFQYANKAAVAEQLAAVAAKAAGDVKTARKDAREELAAQRAEQVAALTYEATLITKAKELDALKNPKDAEPDPLKEAQLQQTLAQVQLLHAQAALADRTNK